MLGLQSSAAPQVFQDVMSNEQFVTCFYCNRILYFVPPPPKEADAGSVKAATSEPTNEEPVQSADEAAAH